MKKLFMLLAAALLIQVLVSCATEFTPSTIAGTYTGILPCADCEGISTRIELKQNGSYTLENRYLGKPEELFVQYRGSFSVSKGNILTLHGMTEQSAPASYVIGKDTLTQLDMDGNVITGILADLYILKKE
jgi:uncharacterized lipoprotein NlpE involved in copper resistance